MFLQSAKRVDQFRRWVRRVLKEIKDEICITLAEDNPLVLIDDVLCFWQRTTQHETGDIKMFNGRRAG